MSRIRFCLLKLCRPLPGALAGAVVGFHVYFRQPGLNTDTAALLFIAGLWAFGGLLIGMVGSSFAAWLIERALRRVLVGKPLFIASAIMLLLTALSPMLVAPLEARLPALFWPEVHKLPARLQSVVRPSTCSDDPPTEVRARQARDLECR